MTSNDRKTIDKIEKPKKKYRLKKPYAILAKLIAAGTLVGGGIGLAKNLIANKDKKDNKLTTAEIRKTDPFENITTSNGRNYQKIEENYNELIEENNPEKNEEIQKDLIDLYGLTLKIKYAKHFGVDLDNIKTLDEIPVNFYIIRGEDYEFITYVSYYENGEEKLYTVDGEDCKEIINYKTAQVYENRGSYNHYLQKNAPNDDETYFKKLEEAGENIKEEKRNSNKKAIITIRKANPKEIKQLEDVLKSSGKDNEHKFVDVRGENYKRESDGYEYTATYENETSGKRRI